MIGTTGLDGRPRDPELGGPVPFVCEDDDGRGSMRTLVKKRVIQCALSRICAVCGETLDHPLMLLGPVDELDRMEFHLPPVHEACGRAVGGSAVGADFAVLGQEAPVSSWVLVSTAGFEHERPQRFDPDQRPRFRPNRVLETYSL